MKDKFSDYADNYLEYKNFIYSFLESRPITDGYDAQCDGLYFIDEED